MARTLCKYSLSLRNLSWETLGENQPHGGKRRKTHPENEKKNSTYVFFLNHLRVSCRHPDLSPLNI